MSFYNILSKVITMFLLHIIATENLYIFKDLANPFIIHNLVTAGIYRYIWRKQYKTFFKGLRELFSI